MWKVVRIEVQPGYRLWVEFADGLSGVVDLSADLWGPLGEPLRAPGQFALAAIDAYGAVGWPNGFDVAPDYLRAALAGRPETRSAGFVHTSRPAPDRT